MKNFQIIIDKEVASFELPSDLKMSEIIDFLINKGCKITPRWSQICNGTRVIPEHEKLDMSYSEWFRRFVSDW